MTSPSLLLAVPNVTAHPSTASVPITVLLYNGALLCGFNVPIKGLTTRSSAVAAIGCYIWYSEEEPGRAVTSPSPLIAVPNVTAHPSTASVPITV